MKFKIEDKNNKEKIVKLSLEKIGKKDNIVLTATDGKGINFILMAFKDGKFRRIADVPNDIGIEVDGLDRIVEDK